MNLGERGGGAGRQQGRGGRGNSGQDIISERRIKIKGKIKELGKMNLCSIGRK